MVSKEYKVRNRKDAKIICAKFTLRIETYIRDEWFITVRIRQGHKYNPLGYRIEFYVFPDILAREIIRVDTIEETKKIIKIKTGITIPIIAFDRFEANKLADIIRGKKWKR